MPKMKSKKAAVKRFVIKKSGKIMRGRQNTRHIKLHKSKSQLDRYAQSAQVTAKAFKKLIVRLIGYNS